MFSPPAQSATESTISLDSVGIMCKLESRQLSPRKEVDGNEKRIEPETGPFSGRTYRILDDGANTAAPPAWQGKQPRERPRDFLNTDYPFPPMFEMRVFGFTPEEISGRWKQYGIDRDK